MERKWSYYRVNPREPNIFLRPPEPSNQPTEVENFQHGVLKITKMPLRWNVHQKLLRLLTKAKTIPIWIPPLRCARHEYPSRKIPSMYFHFINNRNNFWCT